MTTAATDSYGGRLLSRFSLLPLADDLERLGEHLGARPGRAAVGRVRDRMKDFDASVTPLMGVEETGLYLQVEERLGDGELGERLRDQHRHIRIVAGQIAQLLDRLPGAEADTPPGRPDATVPMGTGGGVPLGTGGGVPLGTGGGAAAGEELQRLRVLLGQLAVTLRDHNRHEELAVAAYLRAHLQAPQPGRLPPG